jgi:hypothetical protein
VSTDALFVLMAVFGLVCFAAGYVAYPLTAGSSRDEPAESDEGW